MKNKAFEKLQSMSAAALRQEMARYVGNDCDGHGVNLRLGYLKTITDLLDTATRAELAE